MIFLWIYMIGCAVTSLFVTAVFVLDTMGRAQDVRPKGPDWQAMFHCLWVVPMWPGVLFSMVLDWENFKRAIASDYHDFLDMFKEGGG